MSMEDAKYFFGQTVRTFRNGIRLSQEKFAFKAGIDRTYLASVENGKRNVSIEIICRIVNGLSVSLSEFFQRMEEIKTTNDNTRIKKKN